MWEKHEAICSLNQAEEDLMRSRSQLQHVRVLLNGKDHGLSRAGEEIACLIVEVPKLLQERAELEALKDTLWTKAHRFEEDLELYKKR